MDSLPHPRMAPCHPPLLCALAYVLLLAASAVCASPANHDRLMHDKAYRDAFESYAARERMAEERLDASDFAAARKAARDDMAEAAGVAMRAGMTETEAWSAAYALGHDSLERELAWDWLRRHPEGIQGFYRREGRAFDGWLTVRGEDAPGRYAVRLFAMRRNAPFNSGELDGSGAFKDGVMRVAQENDNGNPLRIIFNGDTATVVETQAFRESGTLGAGVSLEGSYRREKKGEMFSREELERMSVFLSNFTEIGMMRFTAEEVLHGENPSAMVRFGIWHNYINNYKSRIRPCAVRNCPWGSLTIRCDSVRESLRRYFGSAPDHCPSAPPPDAASLRDGYHFDGTRYHFEGADGEAVYHARVDSARHCAGGLIEMRGVIHNAGDGQDVPGGFVALARPHVWKGRETWAIVSLTAQVSEEERR